MASRDAALCLWPPDLSQHCHQLCPTGRSYNQNAVCGLQGATATVSLRQPRTEAHLSQLAVLENFAEHGLYVKFSNQEAEELEREALALALEESTQEVGTDRSAISFQITAIACGSTIAESSCSRHLIWI